MFRTLRTPNALNVRHYDYDQDHVRNELNTLRHNMHELCTRTMTNFDCNRFLPSNDSIINNKLLTNTGSVPLKNIEYVNLSNNKKNRTDNLLVESVPLREVRVNNNHIKYGECIG